MINTTIVSRTQINCMKCMDTNLSSAKLKLSIGSV